MESPNEEAARAVSGGIAGVRKRLTPELSRSISGVEFNASEKVSSCPWNP